MRCRESLAALLAVALLVPARAPAQDSNVLFPVDSIERLLLYPQLEVVSREGSRFEADRTQRVVLQYPDSSVLMVKWATAPRGGEAFNNQPRYEVAAYRLQRLFLDEPDYVVPPTVVRGIPLAWYRTLDAQAGPTFDDGASVLVVLQYWLFNVTQRDVYDRQRLASDSAYARRFANLNLLTYLIRHVDANQGNVLISQDPTRPRMFSVDNGVAFASEKSNRGTEWRDLRTDRLPLAVVERLRRIQREDLDRELGVLAQFEEREGELHLSPAGENLGRNAGVRRREGVLQLGLTAREIDGVHNRLQSLLRRVDRGRIKTF